MKIYVTGMIIRETNFGEKDKIVNIFTAEKGIISAIVKQGKVVNSKRTSIAQLFAYSRFTLYVGKNGYTVDETEILQLFWDIRKNLNTLAVTAYFCELCMAWTPDESSSPELLRLLLNALFFLSKKSKNIEMVKAVFELRGCSMCGYMPNLVGCYCCKAYKSPDMKFLIGDGTIICGKCAKNSGVGRGYMLSPGLLATLRHIVYSDLKKLFSFSVSLETEKLLCKVCEEYIFTHVGSKFKSLEFYKSVSDM